MEYPLVPFHHRLEQIGYQACHEKRKEHPLEGIEQSHGCNKGAYREKNAHHAIECIGATGGQLRCHKNSLLVYGCEINKKNEASGRGIRIS